MRSRRRPCGFSSRHRLSGRPHAPDQSAQRAGCACEAVSGELLQAESGAGRDLRTQPATAAGQTGGDEEGAWEMIHLRRSGQRSFAEGLIEEEIEDLWEPWMRQADKVLEYEQLLTAVYEALGRRNRK